ncbi:galactoside O-acetyltransferase [Tenuifilaceae bacterium CYCD]|nr:galactoside O-acetyltransferase [Tenuifilaceae bacterium CYCD]
MINSFLSRSELDSVGFKKVGKDVKVSRFASFYNPSKIILEDNCRIDDFCILSGEIHIGKHSHISAYCALYGAMGIYIDDFSGLSARCTVYSAMDDFSGDYLIGATLPKHLTNVTGGKVTIEKYCQIGAGSIIFPNLNIAEGSVVGSMSLVNKSTQSWGIYIGIPIKFLKERKKNLLRFDLSSL